MKTLIPDCLKLEAEQLDEAQKEWDRHTCMSDSSPIFQMIIVVEKFKEDSDWRAMAKYRGMVKTEWSMHSADEAIARVVSRMQADNWRRDIELNYIATEDKHRTAPKSEKLPQEDRPLVGLKLGRKSHKSRSR